MEVPNLGRRRCEGGIGGRGARGVGRDGASESGASAEPGRRALNMGACAAAEIKDRASTARRMPATCVQMARMAGKWGVDERPSRESFGGKLSPTQAFAPSGTVQVLSGDRYT